MYNKYQFHVPDQFQLATFHPKQQHSTTAAFLLQISKIEKSVSIDRTRPCIYTYKKNKKIQVRINTDFTYLSPKGHCRRAHRDEVPASNGRPWGYLQISEIEKSVSIDPTRPCIQTYNQNIQIQVRITSTVNVIRASIFQIVVGTGSYTTSTTNMYHQHVQDFTYYRDTAAFVVGVNTVLTFVKQPHRLKINHIEKRLVLILLVLVLTHQNTQIHVRITSTVNVIRACMSIMWSVLEGTQRVPPTCTLIQISRT